MLCIMGCKETSYIVTEYFNESFYTVCRQRLDYVEMYPVTNLPVTISELDIDVQLVNQFSKIPGHKIKARIRQHGQTTR